MHISSMLLARMMHARTEGGIISLGTPEVCHVVDVCVELISV